MKPDRVLDKFEEPRVRLEIGGQVEEIVFNRYIPDYHAAQFLNRKYGWPRCLTHFIRLTQVIRFLAESRDRLVELGLIVPADEADNIDGDLFEALSVCPFTRAVRTGRRKKEWDFDFDLVLSKVKELEAS